MCNYLLLDSLQSELPGLWQSTMDPQPIPLHPYWKPRNPPKLLWHTDILFPTRMLHDSESPWNVLGWKAPATVKVEDFDVRNHRRNVSINAYVVARRRSLSENSHEWPVQSKSNEIKFRWTCEKQYLPSPSPVLYCLFMPSPFWLVPPATYFYHLRKPPPHESRNHLNHLRITTPKRIKPYCCAKFLARSTLHRRAHGSTPRALQSSGFTHWSHWTLSKL